MTSDAQAAPAFDLSAFAVAETVAVPDVSNGIAVEWRVKRLTVAQATKAGLLSGVIGAAVAQAQPDTGKAGDPGAAQVEGMLRVLFEGGEKAVLAAVTGIRAAGSDVWTDCRVMPVGGEDPAAGRLSVLSVSVAGQIAIVRAALAQAMEAVQSVSSFRAG
ncbi:MAG: hypothetical protein RLZZ412_97 [Verrucomicrobiota bacterium]|jgi:hypothetical protein